MWHRFNLTIQKRVEYLSLAVGNAKSQYPSNRGESVEFLTDIEEKLEVAQVQIEIYREISESTNLRNEEKGQWLAKLEGGLLTISDVRLSLLVHSGPSSVLLSYAFSTVALPECRGAVGDARDDLVNLSRFRSSGSILSCCNVGGDSRKRYVTHHLY